MFIIYSREKCSFCTKAKTLLTLRGFSFEEKQIDRDVTLEAFKELFPTAKTVPQITYNGNNIGGYTELEQYIKTIWPVM